jgi:hypothetical protein
MLALDKLTEGFDFCYVYGIRKAISKVVISKPSELT